MSLKMGLEDNHRGGGGDVLRQTVPNMSSGDQKSPVTDGGQSSAAENQ